jgi:type I restriction enzyme S subunit
MGNIQDGRLDWTDLVYTSDAKEIAKYTLVPGDVLFNRTNSPELVGKAAVFKGERQAVYAGYLIKVRCGDSLLPDFLNYSLGSPLGRDYCWRVKSDGVSQSNINAKKLAAFPFRLFSLDEQQEIVRRVEELFAFADACSARATTTTERVASITASCLAKAFRGELVPQDPDDEPASELLARIRAARAAEEETKPNRGGKRRTRTKKAPEVAMLTRSDVKPDHLSAILKERGALSAEVLWNASQLDIDEFYEQLKEEEAQGLLRERRGKGRDDARLLEPAA